MRARLPRPPRRCRNPVAGSSSKTSGRSGRSRRSDLMAGRAVALGRCSSVGAPVSISRGERQRRIASRSPALKRRRAGAVVCGSPARSDGEALSSAPTTGSEMRAPRSRPRDPRSRALVQRDEGGSGADQRCVTAGTLFSNGSTHELDSSPIAETIATWIEFDEWRVGWRLLDEAAWLNRANGRDPRNEWTGGQTPSSIGHATRTADVRHRTSNLQHLGGGDDGTESLCAA